MTTVYVPSRGRAGRCAIGEYLAHGLEPVMVVPMDERETYAEAYPDSIVYGIHVQGIGPTRQWILQHARARGVERFWMLDDDLDDPRMRMHFGASYTFCSWPDWLAAVEDLTAHDRIGAATGMSRQWAWMEDSAIPNVRVGYAWLMRTDMPVDFWQFLHEDTDMSIQILEAGYQTLKLPQYVFHTTTMNWKGGGCQIDYDRGAAVAAGEALRAKWNAKHPGLVGLRTNKEGNIVTRIKWSRYRQGGTFIDGTAH